MKKITITLLFLFLFIPVCKCASWTSNLPKDKNIKILSIEERYKWYKEEKINEEIKNAFEHNCEYFENVESVFSEWSTGKPEEKNNRIIEEKEEIELPEYNSITISGFYSNSLKIKELKILNSSNQSINYEIKECINCIENREYFNNIKDGKYTTFLTVKKYTLLKLSLLKAIKGDITILIIYDNDSSLFGWKTTLSMDFSKNVKSLISNTYNLSKIYSNLYSGYVIPKNSNWKYEDNLKQKYYRYKDEFVKCYDLEKKYLSDYYSSYDGYIKDELSKIIFYEYEEVNNECLNNIVLKTSQKSKEDSKQTINELEPLINDTLAINTDSSKDDKTSFKGTIYIVLLCVIFMLLVLICKKIIKNGKESR